MFIPNSRAQAWAWLPGHETHLKRSQRKENLPRNIHTIQMKTGLFCLLDLTLIFKDFYSKK